MIVSWAPFFVRLFFSAFHFLLFHRREIFTILNFTIRPIKKGSKMDGRVFVGRVARSAKRGKKYAKNRKRVATNIFCLEKLISERTKKKLETKSRTHISFVYCTPKTSFD